MVVEFFLNLQSCRTLVETNDKVPKNCRNGSFFIKTRTNCSPLYITIELTNLLVISLKLHKEHLNWRKRIFVAGKQIF